MRDGEAEAYASMARAEGDRRNLSRADLGAESGTAAVRGLKPEALRLMEAVVERSNMFSAYERVVKNQGAPGSRWTDGLRVQAMASTALGAGKTGSVVRRISAGDGAQGGNTEAARRGKNPGRSHPG
jgi:hypothetical protein